MSDKKYLSVGSIVEFDDGKAFISIDNLTLRGFMDYVSEHGAKFLKGLTEDEIKEGQKSGDIPRIRIYMFEPNDKAPDFIKKNLALKVR